MTFDGVQRVLVCLRYGIGDLIMQLPALRALRGALPSAHITAIGAEPAIELLDGERIADEVVSVHTFGLRDWGDRGDDGSREEIGRWLRRPGFDLIIDPSHAVLGLGLAIWDSGHPRILDAGRDLENHHLRLAGNGAAALRAAVAEGWGIPIPAEAPTLHFNTGERGFANRFLANHGLWGKRLYAISAVASSPLKRWPVERLVTVARQLVDEHDAAALLLFAGGDGELASLWETLAPPDSWWLVPRLHLRRTAALLAHCDLAVTNDTGLNHLAAAVGIPTVATFGPTSPAIYQPSHGVGIAAPVACEQRREHSFGPPACVAGGRCLQGRRSCIEAIDTDTVLAAVRAVRDKPASTGFDS